METNNRLVCGVERGRVFGDLRTQEGLLRDRFGMDAIVNCTGLGAMELAGDDMYPCAAPSCGSTTTGVRYPASPRPIVSRTIQAAASRT